MIPGNRRSTQLRDVYLADSDGVHVARSIITMKGAGSLAQLFGNGLLIV